MGRDLGLSSKECSSAKEVFRTIDKSIACAMSLTDNLVCIGIPYEKAVKFSTNEGKLFFNGIIENLNVNPKELTKDEEK